MSASVRARYSALVEAREIERDPAQVAAIARLSALETRLAEFRLGRKSSSLGWLFGQTKREPVKGLYLHGAVGRGKTMLMDLFFEASPVVRKRRVHFHEFMSDVHERVYDFRTRLKAGEVAGEDAIALTAEALAQEAWLLCFDEFHVTDIADAMILGRLFTRLFDQGVVVVATSNVAPDDLYRGGLNRALFVPFIRMLKEHLEVMRVDARADFRLEKLAGVKIWHVPADHAADAALDDVWRRLTGGHDIVSHDFVVRGHPLHVPRMAMGAARFTFHELCERPLGAADYLRIAHEFHTLVIDRIPLMTYETRNAAKRFITLVDTLYDHAVKLVASAAAPPDELYHADAGFEATEFSRTASRLIEMGSQSYLSLPHGRNIAATGASAEGVVET